MIKPAVTRIDVEPERYLRAVGHVFAVFDARTQDSGNVSYGVAIDDRRYFVKTAGAPGTTAALDHVGRVALLRNAVRLARSLRHPALPELESVVESPHGPMLVYSWRPGELLGVPRARRDDPDSSFRRFRALPTARILAALDVVFELHARLAVAGWVAVDFYDGALLYDFATGRLSVIDLDNYRDGPFCNERGRLFGSSRFMAPEEFEMGALIDQRTNVFTMGRTLRVFLDDAVLSPELRDVAARACAPDRGARFATMADFHRAWRAALDVASP